MADLTHWMTVSESNYPWEREALEFIRARFPSHEPYRAWSNFEFIAEDGSVNEVDLLVFSPEGFFLVEIKSRPGRLFGDAGTWRWETDGKFSTRDNPLILANSKAKKLRSLLQRQKVCKNKGPLPYLDALVFCSAEGLQFELRDTAAYHVCLRDRDKTADAPARPGILAAIQRRECPGLDKFPRGTFDRPMAKLVSQAMEQAGIRPSVKKRTVSDYELKQIIGNGPGYQDWLATHVRLADVTRRVRLYHVRTESSADDREKIERAALREFQILESLQHPGVLRTYGFTEHAMGPALIFEHEPGAMRLDHYLIERRDRLGAQERLELMRQIAEVVRFAHDKKVVHRALSPQSILVVAPDGPRPRIKLFNWQVGYRDAATTSSGGTRLITATSHVDRLVEDATTAYMAPEALSDEHVVGEHLDVFSLGAIAYHLFSGVPPAANGLELSNKIRETKGLQISSVLNGAGEHLQFVIQFATTPEVMSRLDSASDFLEQLDQVEDELTAPAHEYVTDPGQAQKGDLLPGDLTVLRRLGQGACSVAFLVERAGQEYVLKAANDTEQNGRVRDEADVLKNMHRHSHIVEVSEEVEIGDRAGFLMRPVFVEKAERRLETLGQRLRKEGRLQLDHLQRFGKDLLEVVEYLQEQGVAHRDIKPDNIAVGMVGKADALHAVLFDFSLSRTPAENIRAGTSGYLDPLLPLRKPPRWDLHAERYAAAVTLYEMATGTMPKWGDGATDPSHLDCEVTIDAELFDAGVRESLSEFFRKAFRRDPARRFDNAEVMRSAWSRCFENIDQPGALTDHEDEEALRDLLAGATHDSQIHELGLGARATNALDRANLLTVEDLLTVPMRRLLRLRGVGNKTRREIAAAVRLLREQLGAPASTGNGNGSDESEGAGKGETLDPSSLSVDLLAQRIIPRSKDESDRSTPMIRALLGLEDKLREAWPSQTDVADFAQVTRTRVSQVVSKLQSRWAKEPAVTRLRDDLAGFVESAGGAMLVAELAEALIAARGSALDEPIRTRHAHAVVRAAVEVERSMGDPRFQVRRNGDRVLIALSQDLAGYAFRLGDLADQIAGEDPLVPPLRVLQQLRDVPAPASMVPLADSRLVRLAASASSTARLSSRQELYPRGMDAGRALKLSQGALYGVPALTLREMQDRVWSRYPESAPLPPRPALDSLLDEAGFELRWEPTLKGVGGYVSTLRDAVSVTSETRSTLRPTAGLSGDGLAEFTPELADVRQFEERLQRGVKDGSFYALLVPPRHYQSAVAGLAGQFSLDVIDFEGLFLDALRQVAEKARVNWDLILKTDARPREGDWNKLLLLVNRAMPLVEEQIAVTDKPILMIYANLMARYDRMDLLERLRDKVGRRDGIPSLWLLLPGDQQAFMDGKNVPVLSPSQRVRIPASWLRKHSLGDS